MKRLDERVRLPEAANPNFVATHAFGFVGLYLGDAAQVIPQLQDRIDLIATDPPYGMTYQSNYRKTQFDTILGDEKKIQAGDIRFILSKAVDKLRNGRHVYSFGPSELLHFHSLSDSVQLIWSKMNLGMGDFSIPWGLAHEPINFAIKKDKSEDRHADGGLSTRIRKGSIIHCMRFNGTTAERMRHPTEKPVELMMRLIESSSSRGETVLDPFMGSGSTVVAAMLCGGRNAIGIEIDKANFDIAKTRVSRLVPLLDALEGA
jgi:site-specific DNA-methyltransferase (adenine-specific)